MAGAGGIEPPNGGIKIRCLTAWLRPKNCIARCRSLLPRHFHRVSETCSPTPPCRNAYSQGAEDEAQTNRQRNGHQTEQPVALSPCRPQAGNLHRQAAQGLQRPSPRNRGRSTMPRTSADKLSGSKQWRPGRPNPLRNPPDRPTPRNTSARLPDLSGRTTKISIFHASHPGTMVELSGIEPLTS